MKHFWQTIKDKLTKIDYFFLALIFFGSLFFTFAIPPMQKPDEGNHYYAVLNIVSGNPFCKPEQMIVAKKSFVNLVSDLSANIAFNQGNKFYFENFKKNIDDFNYRETTNTKCIYLRSAGYLPSAIILEPFYLWNNNSSPIIGFYFMRLLNSFIFLLAIIFSIYFIPKKFKPILLLFCLLPMVLHQTSAVGYDALLISLSLVIFSLVLFLQENFITGKIKEKHFFILAILIALIQLTKPGYYLFLLLLFLFPFYKYVTKKQFFITIGLTFFVTFLPFISTLSGVLNGMNDTYQVEVEHNRRLATVNRSDQLEIFLKNPIITIDIIKDTMADKGFWYLFSTIGIFGWLDTQLTVGMYLIFILLIFSLIIYQTHVTGEKMFFNNRQIILLSLMLLGTIIFIFGVFYLSWTPIGETNIEGVQGRYFLPILPFLLFLMIELIKKIKLKNLIFYLLFLAIIFLSIKITKVVYNRYWNYDFALNKPITDNFEATQTGKLK